MAGDEHKPTEKPLEIVCRIAPKKNDQEICVIPIDGKYVKVFPPKSFIPRNNEPFIEKIYKFDYVFEESDTQRDVFKQCTLDFVENLLGGNNSLLFTYGVTGSGKTHTMTGNADGDNSGLLPRALDVLFKSLPNIMEKCVFKPDERHGFIIQSELQAMKERQTIPPPQYSSTNRLIETIATKGLSHTLCCAVFVSYVEIYNDLCYDLLDESLTDERLFSSKNIRQDPVTSQTYVEKIKEVEVQSSDEAIEQFLQAQERRRTAKTLLNQSSSRSHSVFNIRLVTAPLQRDKFYPVNNNIHVSEMSLVDLAGSERAKRTENTGDRLAESNKINQSLLTLRQCFEKLRQSQRSQNLQSVPYRDSKLTYLFKNFFEGGGRIRMIICVNPLGADYEENLHVMKFAKLAREVKMATVAAPVHALEQLNTLPFNRRDMAQWNKEFVSSVGHFEPKLIELFDKPPRFQVKDCNDAHSITNIREYFTKKLTSKENYRGTVRKNVETFSEVLKKRLCFGDLSAAQNGELMRELTELREDYGKLSNTFTQLKRENNSLRTAVSRYETYEINDKRREDEAQRDAREKDKALQSQRRTLQKLGEVLETPVTRSHVATLREQFDTAVTPPRVPQSLQPRHQSQPRPRLQDYPASARRHDENQPPSHVQSTLYTNPKFQRRSKSTGRVLDHEPKNLVPLGTIFQPQLPRNTCHTTRPSTDDLKKCSDYVVTRQTADKHGNIRTQLVKGRVIPTAGGGSAVVFDDIEVLHHDSPM